MDKDKETLGLIFGAKATVIRLRYLLWLFIIVFSIVGLFFWKWYFIPILIVAELIFGSWLSDYYARRVEKLTGLDNSEQEALIKEKGRDLPFKEKKVTPQEMANDIWDALAQWMMCEIDKANKLEKEKLSEELGLDCDINIFIEEYPFIFVFLIYGHVLENFPEKGKAILIEFNEILKKKNMDCLLDGVNDYMKAWDEACYRETKKDDDSLLRNPLYSISKLASIRCFGGKEGLHTQRIMIFTNCINPFKFMLHEFFKEYVVVG